MNSLVFLHLSDIHFSKRSDSNYDPDLDLRRELVSEAIRLREQIGACSGVLVCGDIAFSGVVEEYEKAKGWLSELCEKLDCSQESVWVIPGNHDVDRSIVNKSTTIQDKHSFLRKKRSDYELQRLHEDPEAFETILRPFSAYQTFAGHYNCLPKSGHLYWADDVPLNDGSFLRIRGCNSAIVSDDNDDEGENRMVVGTNQVTAESDNGIVNLIMCHHPLDWMFERDAIKDCLKARARLVLFGHKHKQCIEKIENTLMIESGAVHPSRHENGWLPRFNFIRIGVEMTDSKRELKVETWSRIWDDVRKHFKADFDVSGSDCRIDHLTLPNWVRVGTNEAFAKTSENTVNEEGRIVNPKRRMVFRFHSLPYVSRVEIAIKLSLIAEEDSHLSEEAKYTKYFQRAEERAILDELWNAIEQKHGVDLPGPNPFTKEQRN
jgi:predicted phosphodiesterase